MFKQQTKFKALISPKVTESVPGLFPRLYSKTEVKSNGCYIMGQMLEKKGWDKKMKAPYTEH